MSQSVDIVAIGLSAFSGGLFLWRIVFQSHYEALDRQWLDNKFGASPQHKVLSVISVNISNFLWLAVCMRSAVEIWKLP